MQLKGNSRKVGLTIGNGNALNIMRISNMKPALLGASCSPADSLITKIAGEGASTKTWPQD
jgi:hypothetical protein